MTAPGSRLRLIALLSVAAWSVHELRYALAFGGHSSGALQASGHGYLQLICPLVGLLVLAAVAQLLHAMTARRERGGRRSAMSLRCAWAVLTAALLAIFAAQELLEGALATGHAPGLAGLVGGGGWLAVPAAAVAGLACALVLREAGEAVDAVPVAAPGLVVLTGRAAAPVLRAAEPRPRAQPPARHLAGRGPPVIVTR